VTCQEIIEFLMAYVDGELPPEQAAVFAQHLADCPVCLEFLHSYRQTVQLSKQALSPGASPANDCPPVPEDLIRAIVAARGQAT
jgi:anti-sigma factor RsiW